MMRARLLLLFPLLVAAAPLAFLFRPRKAGDA